MQETYNALTSLKNKIERLEAIEKKMAEIEEIIKNAGIGQGADLEAYYKIQQIVRTSSFNEDDHNSVAYGTKLQDELNAYKEKDKRLKEIADECVEYIRKNKPVRLWAGTIKRLENAQYAQFISDTVFMYSNGGPLYDYADRMVKELDK